MRDNYFPKEAYQIVLEWTRPIEDKKKEKKLQISAYITKADDSAAADKSADKPTNTRNNKQLSSMSCQNVENNKITRKEAENSRRKLKRTKKQAARRYSG